MYEPLKYKSVEELAGVIESDRVVLKNSKDNKFFQVDGNFGAQIIPSLTKTLSKRLDSATIALMKADFAKKKITLVEQPVFCYADKIVLQSEYDAKDDFVRELADSGVAIIYGYGDIAPTVSAGQVSLIEENKKATCTITVKTNGGAAIKSVTSDKGATVSPASGDTYTFTATTNDTFTVTATNKLDKIATTKVVVSGIVAA